MYIEDMENENREFEVKEQLKEERNYIKSFDELVSFLQKIKEECNTGYGTAPRAIAQAALATAWYLATDFGITGFQAGCTMWDFIEGWMFTDNKCGMKIVNYDDMLFPQYDDKFDKTISKDTFEALQKEARKKLEERGDYVHPAVKQHWIAIASGGVPFGYDVKE